MSALESPLGARALEIRQAKQQCAARFPGRLTGWGDAAGRTVATAVGPLVLFTDGSFLYPGGAPRAEEQADALLAAGELLRPHHAEAVAELERLAAEEREAMRLARMEKVLAAVRNNLPEIPELREQLLALLQGSADSKTA